MTDQNVTLSNNLIHDIDHLDALGLYLGHGAFAQNQRDVHLA